MNILVGHNHYLERGGEDEVFDSEVSLLRRHGHKVIPFELSNSLLSEMSRVKAASRSLWSRETYRALARILFEESIDLAHFHNTAFVMSPSCYHACKGAGVPVVQTLHNYRLMCPVATFFRDGRPCEDCKGRVFAWPGVVHACYRNNRTQTALVGLVSTFHRMIGTYDNMIDLYIAPSNFAKCKLVEGGVTSEKIHVKTNFVYPDPGVGSGNGHFALFVGRLSPEKGVDILMEAWEEIGSDVPLKLVGDGPLSDFVLERIKSVPSAEWLGSLQLVEVYKLMKAAMVTVVPSTWYETFGRVVTESFACGTPVVGSNIGSVSELVSDDLTGLKFEAGQAGQLKDKVMTGVETGAFREMRPSARQEFEDNYTAESNYSRLMEIYEIAMNKPASVHRRRDLG